MKIASSTRIVLGGDTCVRSGAMPLRSLPAGHSRTSRSQLLPSPGQSLFDLRLQRLPADLPDVLGIDPSRVVDEKRLRHPIHAILDGDLASLVRPVGEGLAEALNERPRLRLPVLVVESDDH